jgi:hypothetical protein
MRAERALLRIGEYLVGRACRRLPREIRDERYREWAAELPAILRDPEVRAAPYRAARMLFYAADTLRGTALAPARARRRPAPFTSLLGLLFIAGLVLVVWGIRDTVRAPGSWVNYMQVTWSLFLVAWPVSQYVRSAARMTVLIVISGNLAGVVVCAWKAVQAPRDWANYFVAACQFLLVLVVLACWLVSRRVRAGGHDGRPLAE